MTWQAALKFCIDNPGKCVWDRDNHAHVVSVDSGAPRLRSDVEVRPFDPDGEPYRATKRAVEIEQEQNQCAADQQSHVAANAAN